MFIKNWNLRKQFGMGRLMEADTGANSGGNSGTETDKTDAKDNTQTEKEKQEQDNEEKKFTQKELDKLITERVTRERKGIEDKIQEAKTEAEKLAKMNADEKAKYAESKRVEDLEKREKEITTRELQATAKATLVDRGLPIELYEILNYSDAENCNKSIEAVEKAFQASVSKSVNEKLRGKGDPKGGGHKSTTPLTMTGAIEDYYK